MEYIEAITPRRGILQFIIYLPRREIHVANHAFVGVESDFHEALHPALRGRRSGEVDGDSVMSS